MTFKSVAHKLRGDLKVYCDLGLLLFELEASLGVLGFEFTSSERAALKTVPGVNLQVGPHLPFDSHVIMCL